FDELRDLAISALTLADVGIVKEWEGWPEGSRTVVFDPTRERYARDDERGNVTVRRVADDSEIASRPGEGGHVRLEGFDDTGRALILQDRAANKRQRWVFDQRPLDRPVNQALLVGDDVGRGVTADGKLTVLVNYQTGVFAVHDSASGEHLRDVTFGKWKGRP